MTYLTYLRGTNQQILAYADNNNVITTKIAHEATRVNALHPHTYSKFRD